MCDPVESSRDAGGGRGRQRPRPATSTRSFPSQRLLVRPVDPPSMASCSLPRRGWFEPCRTIGDGPDTAGPVGRAAVGRGRPDIHRSPLSACAGNPFARSFETPPTQELSRARSSSGTGRMAAVSLVRCAESGTEARRRHLRTYRVVPVSPVWTARAGTDGGTSE